MDTLNNNCTWHSVSKFDPRALQTRLHPIRLSWAIQKKNDLSIFLSQSGVYLNYLLEYVLYNFTLQQSTVLQYTVSRLRPPQPRRHRHQQHHWGEARRPHRYPPCREGEESQAAHDRWIRSSLLFSSLDPPWLLPVARVKEDWEETLAAAAPRKPLFACLFNFLRRLFRDWKGLT